MPHLNLAAVAAVHVLHDACSPLALLPHVLIRPCNRSQAHSHTCNLAAAHAHAHSRSHFHARVCPTHPHPHSCSIQRSRQAHGKRLWLRLHIQLKLPLTKRARVRNEVAAAHDAGRHFSAHERSSISASRPLLPPAREMVSVVGFGLSISHLDEASCCGATFTETFFYARAHASERAPCSDSEKCARGHGVDRRSRSAYRAHCAHRARGRSTCSATRNTQHATRNTQRGALTSHAY